MEQSFMVEDREAGQRLDKWLMGKMPTFSRKQIKALLDGGRVLINRRRVVIAGWELEPADSVEVRTPPGLESRVQQQEEKPDTRARPARRAREPRAASHKGVAERGNERQRWQDDATTHHRHFASTRS